MKCCYCEEEGIDEAQRSRLGNSIPEILADLHAVDPDAVGLGDLGRKENYLARQLKRWRTQWEKSKTRELDAMEEVYRESRAEVGKKAKDILKMAGLS